MNDTTLPQALRLDDRIATLIRHEQGAVVDVLLALAEFDRLKLYRSLGHANLFDYLHRRRKLSRGAAHYRRVAAGLVDRFPEVIEPLRDGRLCFTTVVVVAGVLTKENVQSVLPRFFGLSKQEALELAAELRPRELVPERTVVTRPEVRAADPKVQPGELETPPMGVPAPAPAPPPPPRTQLEPMTATLSRMHLTVSRELVELLKTARAGQSHVEPHATDEQVIIAGLRLLIAQQEKRKASVPAKVKRAVMARDEARCQWPTHDGSICGATVKLEVDHIQPRGKGGPSTVANCRILCKPHNLEAARNTYGDELMNKFTGSVREPPATYGTCDTEARPWVSAGFEISRTPRALRARRVRPAGRLPATRLIDKFPEVVPTRTVVTPVPVQPVGRELTHPERVQFEPPRSTYSSPSRRSGRPRPRPPVTRRISSPQPTAGAARSR